MLCVATNDASRRWHWALGYTRSGGRVLASHLEYGLIAAQIAGVLVRVVTHFATGVTALFTLAAPIATSG